VKLFHLSDDPGISLFEPRWHEQTSRALVWAIDERRIANYLLPRDCPRVCFWRGPAGAAEDGRRLLGDEEAIIAIESGWLDRVERAELYRYTFPADRFVLEDETAGYWVSYEPIVPQAVERVADLPSAIAAEGAKLVALPELWKLHDAVAASSLMFSMIRMRNAQRRQEEQ